MNTPPHLSPSLLAPRTAVLVRSPSFTGAADSESLPPSPAEQSSASLVLQPLIVRPTSPMVQGLQPPAFVQASASTRPVFAQTPEPPEHFLDLATQEVMVDPVVCSDGFTYERKTAERLNKSPMTREPLKILVANVALRSAIWDMFPDLAKSYKRPDMANQGEKTAEDPRGPLQGRNLWRWSDGQIFEGTLENGTPQGEGRYTTADGYVWAGTFRDGRLEGQGTFHTPQGDEYSGSFLRGRFHGIGTLSAATGGRYQGEFHQDTKHGFGSLYLTTGREYHGQWSHNQADGEGLLKITNFWSYLGGFEENAANGCGFLIDHRNPTKLYAVSFSKGKLERPSTEGLHSSDQAYIWSLFGGMPFAI